MTVRVLLFSSLRDQLGESELVVGLPEDATTEVLLDQLALEYEAVARFRPYTRVAVNAAYAQSDTRLHDGDEVALITPTSGG